MSLNLEPKKQLSDYLAVTDMIDSNHPVLKSKAESLIQSCQTTTQKAQRLFEFVRDDISHSFDIQNSQVTYKASDVLQKGHGICFSKSHLLAAMNRAVGIPTGFCYQKLIFDDTIPNPHFFLHGLNAVYLDAYKRWIRLDARGNKPGVVSEFNLKKEQLAFYVRPELGEEDYMEITAEPEHSVIYCLSNIDHWDWKSMDKQLPSKLKKKF